MHFGGAWQTVRPELYEWLTSVLRQEQAQNSAADSKQCALGKALTYETAAVCSQRSANGKFPFARHCSRQQQTRDVHARNQQNQVDCTQEEPERGFDALD